MQNDSKRIDVIIPVYNEEEMVDIFYQRINKVPLEMNLVFVDNASTDSTVNKIKAFKDVTLIRHDTNEGYGSSIIDGIRNSSGDLIVIIDADCEFPPESIPAMVEGLHTEDVVYASRFFSTEDANMPRFRIIGNKLISNMFNLLFHQKTTDLYTGMKAFKRSALDGITLQKKGFEHVLEMGVKLSQKKIHISEIPVEYTPRWAGQSKMKHVKETCTYFYRLLQYRFF